MQEAHRTLLIVRAYSALSGRTPSQQEITVGREFLASGGRVEDLLQQIGSGAPAGYQSAEAGACVEDDRSSDRLGIQGRAILHRLRGQMP